MNFLKFQRCFASKSASFLANGRSVVKLPNTTFQTYAALACAKTPIQQYGAEYIQRQKDSHRPLAPHLSIYKPQLTWYVSGAHRILGCVMGGAIVVFAAGMMVMPFDFPQVIEFIRNLGLPVFVTYSLKYIIAFPLVFHILNGIRFLAFDMAHLLDIKQVYASGYAVLALAVIFSIIFTFWRKSDKK